ncbi:hypothetical protein Ddc_01585 [Ditylenchus destructor]|nr:hypothetical protein Ddc_01585 [Ditylenchus destructor]
MTSRNFGHCQPEPRGSFPFLPIASSTSISLWTCTQAKKAGSNLRIVREHSKNIEKSGASVLHYFPTSFVLVSGFYVSEGGKTFTGHKPAGPAAVRPIEILLSVKNLTGFELKTKEEICMTSLMIWAVAVMAPFPIADCGNSYPNSIDRGRARDGAAMCTFAQYSPRALEDKK